jgi:hypothetical protein
MSIEAVPSLERMTRPSPPFFGFKSTAACAWVAVSAAGCPALWTRGSSGVTQGCELFVKWAAKAVVYTCEVQKRMLRPLWVLHPYQAYALQSQNTCGHNRPSPCLSYDNGCNQRHCRWSLLLNAVCFHGGDHIRQTGLKATGSLASSAWPGHQI